MSTFSYTRTENRSFLLSLENVKFGQLMMFSFHFLQASPLNMTGIVYPAWRGINKVKLLLPSDCRDKPASIEKDKGTSSKLKGLLLQRT